MNVLLLSMPDSFEHMAPVAIRIPNGALASLAGNIDHEHHVSIADLILVQGRVRATVERLVHELRPDVVGLSVMTFQRAHGVSTSRDSFISFKPDVRIVAGGYDPSLAPEAYEACADDRFLVRGEGEMHLPRSAARARDRASARGRSPDCPSAPAMRFVHTTPTARSRRWRPTARAAQPRRTRAHRLHAARPARRRRRNLARLHLRLQFLLDHRDARPKLPSLSDRAGARRHRRRPPARRAGDLSGRRQHHARRQPLRSAVPRDHRQRLQRHRLHRPGDDLADRRARRDARAADAPRRLPLRLSRHREHPRRRSRVPQGAGEERRAPTAGSRSATRRSRRSTISIDTAVRRRRPDRRQP